MRMGPSGSGSVRLADLVVDLLGVVDHGVNDRGLGGVVDLVGVVAVVISHTLLVATRDGDGVRVVCDLSRDGVVRLLGDGFEVRVLHDLSDLGMHGVHGKTPFGTTLGLMSTTLHPRTEEHTS